MTVTTILLIIVSVQLISLLKHLKKDHNKESITSVKIPEIKKEKVTKKRINLTNLLEKMKTHISHPKSSKKTFFKS